MPPTDDVDLVELRLKRMATGGEAVGNLADGRVVFVQGGLPDETVRVEILEQKKRFARGVAREVLAPAPQRIEASCSHARSGQCGGCDWMSIDRAAQDAFKRNIVIEQLERLGKIESPQVRSIPTEPGHRTTVRCTVKDGKAGYRGRRSNDSFVAVECGAAHPLIEALIVNGDFGDASEVVLRCGASTGDLMVVTNGSVLTVRAPADVMADVMVVNAESPGKTALYEEVAGQRWRISAMSFFQTSHAGAEALVGAVSEALHAIDGPIIDLYAGVGLLGGAAASDRLTISVESNSSSVADARENLPSSVVVTHAKVEQWKAQRCDAVIADPARRGLGKQGVAAIEGTQSSRLVLVSCDPASLGRDAALLIEQGWRYDQGGVINMFPDTSRIEVVSVFSRD